MSKFSKNLKFDLIAGLTVSIVALPLALGFGVTSGAGAASGLATAIIAGFIAALFGGSNYQVSGPTGAMVVILVPILAVYGTSALFALGLLSGLLLLIMGALRLGRFIEKVPWAVMEGFTLGIALVIALQQLPLIFDVARGEGTESIEVAANTISDALAGGLNYLSISLVALTLLLKYAWSVLSKAKWMRFRIPASAIAVVIVTLLANALQLDVAKIGQLPTSEVFSFSLEWPTIAPELLIYPVVAIALLAAVESLLAARVADAMAVRAQGSEIEKYRPNAELVGQGLATVASALFGGMPSTGAIARTGVNVHAGARTRAAAMFHALGLLVMLLFLAPIVSEIPTAALAGVLLGTSIRIASPRTIIEAMRTTYGLRAVYLVTAISVLLVDLIWGTIIGIVLYALLKRFKLLGDPEKPEAL